MAAIPIVIYVLLCFVVALRARHRSIGFVGAFILSFFVTPVVVFIALILLAPREQPQRRLVR